MVAIESRPRSVRSASPGLIVSTSRLGQQLDGGQRIETEVVPERITGLDRLDIALEVVRERGADANGNVRIGWHSCPPSARISSRPPPHCCCRTRTRSAAPL